MTIFSDSARTVSQHGSADDLAGILGEYVLTPGQSKVAQELGRFLDGDGHNVFVLKGYAGTGKTFLINALVKLLSLQKRSFALAAPTGRAARVITEKTQCAAFTLHSLIYDFDDIKELVVDGIDGSETFKLIAGLKVNVGTTNTVYIVDEASLISDVYAETEFFQSGSGYLLRDLFHFINFDHNNHAKKLILIGDDAQLPPVGMSFSPALDLDYLRTNHGVQCRMLELTDVVRQKSDSGVLKNVGPLRESLKNGIFNKLSFDTSYPDVTRVISDQVVPAYLQSCGHQVNNLSVIITRSNAEAGEFNRSIRENLFPNCSEAVPGDKLMVVKNALIDSIRVSNGDFVWVKSLDAQRTLRKVTLRRKNDETGMIEEIDIKLAFREAQLGYRNVDGTGIFFTTQILENLLYNDRPTLSSDEQKALYVDFCQRNNHLKGDRAAFRLALRDDPFFNALRVKFGYALTCHKAQGSEWPHAFVSCAAMGNPLSADNFRWLYTALTRTSDQLYLLNPPDIGIGDGISIVGNSAVAPATSSTVSTAVGPTSTVWSVPRHETVANKADGDAGPVVGDLTSIILGRVSAELTGTGIEIEGVEHNQYQEAYYFRRDEAQARINICYDSKSRITRIMAVKDGLLSAELVPTLSVLIGWSASSHTAAMAPKLATGARQFSQPFLDEFHQKLLTLTEERGIDVTGVKEMQWCQRYSFAGGGEAAEVDVFYNGRGVFRKCQPVGHVSAPGPLLREVLQLLTVGMST